MQGVGRVIYKKLMPAYDIAVFRIFGDKDKIGGAWTELEVRSGVIPTLRRMYGKSIG